MQDASTRLMENRAELGLYCSEVSNEDVFQFLRQGSNQLDQQAEQSSHLAEGQTPMLPNLTKRA
eukprot:1139420-Pelagomonas_calceolata.AAC.6